MPPFTLGARIAVSSAAAAGDEGPVGELAAGVPGVPGEHPAPTARPGLPLR
jgi:hypothetical protein